MSDIHNISSEAVDADYFVAMCDSHQQRERRKRRIARDRRIALLKRVVGLMVFAIAVAIVVTVVCNAMSHKAEAEQMAVKLGNSDTSMPVIVFGADSDVFSQVTSSENRPARNGRYIDIEMTKQERDELAAIIYLEASSQSAEGQKAVAEVVLNRVIHPEFPNTVHDVLYEGAGTDRPQFSTVGRIGSAEPTQAQYDAIDAALYGESILPADVVFFSRNGENDRVWGEIGDHVFCYEYIWE